MALRKELLQVKEGDQFTFIGQSDYFTNGRGDYRVDEIDYDNGSNTTFVKMIDDEGDLQTLSDVFLKENFKKKKLYNFRHDTNYKKRLTKNN
jgi:hypothetical protein